MECCYIAMSAMQAAGFYAFFLLIIPPPPTSTLFPYTTLFRSRQVRPGQQTNIVAHARVVVDRHRGCLDRKSTRLNSSHLVISYAGFCWKKKEGRAYPLLDGGVVVGFCLRAPD